MEYWNSGKMEYWGSKADDGLILLSDQCPLYKNRSHSTKRGSSVFQPSKGGSSTFHYSIIPLGLKHTPPGLTKAGPSGLGFFTCNLVLEIWDFIV
jgi:hypothetical protein